MRILSESDIKTPVPDGAVIGRLGLPERAGAYALALLAQPLPTNIIGGLAGSPLPLPGLRQFGGTSSRTTLRSCLEKLNGAEIVVADRQDRFPRAIRYELTERGRELLAVRELLQTWLLAAPGGPATLGTPDARSLVKALVDGWCSTMVRAIAAKSLSLNELNSLIAGLNYPSVERRLRAMRLAGLVEGIPSSRDGTLYSPTDWLRASIAPLAVAARWERAHLPAKTTPIGALDIEAALLLAVPKLQLPIDASGDCRLAVELGNSGGDPRLAGVLVEVRGGEIVSCISRLRGSASAWAAGSVGAWLRGVIEHDLGEFEVGGDTRLARALVSALHEDLYRSRIGLRS